MEFNVGNSHIEVWDDYVIHDPVKVQEIMDRIGMIGVKTEPIKEKSLNRAATLVKAM